TNNPWHNNPHLPNPRNSPTALAINADNRPGSQHQHSRSRSRNAPRDCPNNCRQDDEDDSNVPIYTSNEVNRFLAEASVVERELRLQSRAPSRGCLVPCAPFRSDFELRSIQSSGADFDSGQIPTTTDDILDRLRLPTSSSGFDRIIHASMTGHVTRFSFLQSAKPSTVIG
ncbi:hypothetical protein PGT21_000042, partial [Puccinia graminis f. sp. tritici]